MSENKISELLDELQNEEAYKRNDAIKKIIKGKVNDEHIIHALSKVIENDPSQAVRNFARAALDVFGIEHSDIEPDAQVGRKTKEVDIEIQPKLKTDQKDVKNQSDLWLGIALFYGMNFIFWQARAALYRNLNFINTGSSLTISPTFRFVTDSLPFYINLIVIVICLLLKRPNVVRGMLLGMLIISILWIALLYFYAFV